MIGLYIGKNTDNIIDKINEHHKDEKDKYIFDKFDYSNNNPSHTKFSKLLITVQHTDDINNIHNIDKNLLIENIDGILSIQNRNTFNNIIKNVNINNNIYCCPTFDIDNCDNRSKLLIKPYDTISKNMAHNIILVSDLDVLKNNTDIFNYNYIIQPYMDHDTIVYKLYYINEQIFVTHRYSTDGTINEPTGIEYFGRISDKSNNNKIPLDKIIQPLDNDLVLLGNYIRIKFGIYFFGIDIIRNSENGKYYIIDINHCPSFYGIDNVHIILYNEIINLLK